MEFTVSRYTKLTDVIDDVVVVDNFLPRPLFDGIINVINKTQEFQWLYSDYLSDLDEHVENKLANYYFIHPIIETGMIKSNFIETFQPLLNSLNALSCLRARVHMFLNRENFMLYGFHTDYPLEVCHKITSAVLYLDDSNGKTVFKDGREVESKSNRLTAFPAHFLHSSTNCTDMKTRKVINLDYISAK